MRLFAYGALALLMSGCGGGDGFVFGTSVPTLTISSSNGTSTVNESGKYNLTISGNGNNVTVAANNTINTLTLGGVGNLLTIESGTTINEFNASGTSNSVYVPTGSGIAFDSDSGFGNSIVEQ